MSTPKLVVLSNRGPVAWHATQDGRLEARRGSGGLVSALVPALETTGGVWIAAAMSEADRRAARECPDPTGGGTGRYSVRLLDIDPADFERYLDVVSNQVLWYAHHDMWNRPLEPSFGADMYEAWASYVRVNELFALAALEAAGAGPATVLVQDYHLALTPAMIRDGGKRTKVAHFSHTPFAPSSSLAVLPAAWSDRILSGMSAADICGFHTSRWARRFERALAERGLGTETRTEVFPLGPEPESLATERSRPEVERERSELVRRLAGRRAVVRVDRAEPSKNVLRGLDAFGELLSMRPGLVGEVVHLALLNPSRQTLPAYRSYLQECLAAAENLNAMAGREVAIILAEDRYPRSIAALVLADVIVVNPISDGMNLVAKEGPLVNEFDAPLILSTEAGAHSELAGSALSVNPYDVTGTARAMGRALDMPMSERAARAAETRRAAGAHTPKAWLQAQLDALEVGP